MRVITAYPVLYKSKVINRPNDLSNIDGKSSTVQIKQFQSWSNKIKGTNLSVDGKWGPKTASAYKQHGPAFEKAYADTANTLAKISTGDMGSSSNTPSDPALSKTDATGKEKAGMLFNKAKGVWVKAKEEGWLDKAKGLFSQGKSTLDTLKNRGTGTGPSSGGSDYGSGPAPAEEKSGMGKKIAIGAGILLGLFVIYKIATRKRA